MEEIPCGAIVVVMFVIIVIAAFTCRGGRE